MSVSSDVMFHGTCTVNVTQLLLRVMSDYVDVNQLVLCTKDKQKLRRLLCDPSKFYLTNNKLKSAQNLIFSLRKKRLVNFPKTGNQEFLSLGS